MLPTNIMLNLLLQVSVGAAIVKSLIDLYSWIAETIKIKDWPAFGKRLASILISVFFCVYAGLNVMPLLGVESAYGATLGFVLTGLLMARGANIIHDLLSLMPRH
jgi:hypothetical protein